MTGRRPRSWWGTWGWVVGIVAVVAIVGVVIQSLRSGSGEVNRPKHPVGASGAELLGDPTAPVLVEEYGDFQCPACGVWDGIVFPTVERLVHEGTIRFAYYPFAFLGPESRAAASAAVCAGDEGKFWEYRSYLYGNQFPENSGMLTSDYLVDVGRGLGIDDAEFEQCVGDNTYDPWVREVSDQATARGVVGTPTIFVDGRQLPGPPSVEELLDAVERARSA